MDNFFVELGNKVLARWQDANFSPALFPEIAEEALAEYPPAGNVDLALLMRDFLLNDEQPFQTQSPFGQPELVVYDNPRFYIQILFWLEGTMDIHQHTFSGAFHVLEGSSLHAHFTFENVEPVSAHLRLGDLKIHGAKLLEAGSTVQIRSGADCIHSLFHLDTPSLTVVIRTHTDPGTGPQFNYLPPHLAVDPFHNDALTARRKQLLDVLETLGDDTYPDLVLEMIESLDFERGFFVLQNAMIHLKNIERWDDVWDAFADKHGELALRVSPVLDEIIWRDSIVGLRSSVPEAEHRFFLALLLNVPTRREILALVGQRFDGPPVEIVLRWAEELSDTSSVATWILDAEFPSDVKIGRAKPLGVALSALRYFLTGKTKDAPKLSPANLKRVRDSFAASSLRALATVRR